MPINYGEYGRLILFYKNLFFLDQKLFCLSHSVPQFDCFALRIWIVVMTNDDWWFVASMIVYCFTSLLHSIKEKLNFNHFKNSSTEKPWKCFVRRISFGTSCDALKIFSNKNIQIKCDRLDLGVDRTVGIQKRIAPLIHSPNSTYNSFYFLQITNFN